MAEFLYDVFIDACAEDQNVAQQIADKLRRERLRVAPHDLDALPVSRTLILCLSSRSYGSEWPALEARTLRHREPENRDQLFIPLRLDASPLTRSMEQFVPWTWPSPELETYAKSIAAGLAEESSTQRSEPSTVVERRGKLMISLACDDVRAYVLSADGARAMTTSVDGSVYLWDLKSGDCLRTMKGHTSDVFGLSWDGAKLALTSSHDRTIRLWDVDEGKCLRVFRGHTAPIMTVSRSPDGCLAVSGSRDHSVRIWDIQTGRCIRVLEGHQDEVECVAWSQDQQQLLSGSDDRAIRLWDVESGRCLRVLEGHGDWIFRVEWSPDQRWALSGSRDNSVRLWDLQSGLCTRVLNGHKATVWNVRWSPDGQLALSASGDKSARLWEVETGTCLGVLTGHESYVRFAEWSADQKRVLSGDGNGKVLTWEISDLIGRTTNRSATAAPPPAQVQYANAKVLLVGDTGVGKTGLAERLVHGRFIPTKSSHARKAHVLDSKVVKEPGGLSLHQETVLWDLAGQPAYRLVHQLSMEDAALACVLFDCRNETNPFEGAGYWSQVLDQARTNTKLKKLLVASRIDVGGLPAGKERIETFARENEFREFIPTSASTGEGCDALREVILRETPWDQLPKVTTTKTLAVMRDYVGQLKIATGNAARLLTVAALHEGFAAYSAEKVPLADFITHLERLEASDDVELLVFHTTGATPSPDHLVLLDPTRVDAYASALLVAAKDEPDGPGHLLESRVREAKFKLDPDERIPDPDSERHVLWFVMENLLYRDLALRERIKGEDYIVFPSQCTAELRFPASAAFGVAFGFAGAVRSIYATLIAQLAHYEGFRKREFFQDAAAYRPEDGGRCLVRLRDLGHGQGELEVLFDPDTPVSVRQGFLEFVAKHLDAKSNPGSVTRRHAYRCANSGCGEAFDDRVVRANLQARRKDLLCPYCRKKTRLENLLTVATAAAESVAAQISTDANTGRQRMTAALVVRAKEAQRTFDVFLSHNSKDKAAVEKIAKRLLSVGLRPWLDKWTLPPGGTLSDALEEAIKTIPCAALCFGPADIGRWHVMEIRAYVEKWASGNARLIPVILPGVKEIPELPIFVRQTLWADMRDWETPESPGFYNLVCGILGKPPGDAPMKRFGVRDVAQWQGRET
ncbi:MAG TPA: TIR domain-containing protein [Thermoanaerobaculia bacterium]|nr:TIR domain-containing protein [Thermoanaerobaculia bacterium]